APLNKSVLSNRGGGRPPPDAPAPRFRGRLRIPCGDPQGGVIASPGRQRATTPADDPARDAKYINSPETPLFNKSQVLFALDRARLEVNEEKPFLMVEGQLDAIRCRETGLTTAIAPQGTAVTEHQLLLLRRYSPRIDCLLDGDEAGQKAAMRVLPMTLKLGLEVRFFVLPAGQDPDALLAAGGMEAWQELSRQPVSAMRFAASALLPDPRTATAQEKARAAEALFEMISASESEIVRTDYVDEAAGLLRIDRASAHHDFARFVASKHARRRPAPPPESP